MLKKLWRALLYEWLYVLVLGGFMGLWLASIGMFCGAPPLTNYLAFIFGFLVTTAVVLGHSPILVGNQSPYE